MEDKLKYLYKKLEMSEDKLNQAYVNYAKIIDDITSIEMNKINEMVDEIIVLKRLIKEEEGRKEND